MKTVEIFNAQIEVFTKGVGDIPLLVLGPASFLMKNDMLPEAMEDLYTIYYIDIFSDKIELSKRQIKNLTLDDFLGVIEEIRLQLNIPIISLFSHSAMGVLGYEYAVKYPNQVSSLILIATSPTWANQKKKTSALFFDANSTEERKALRAKDEGELKISVPEDKRDRFIKDYVSRRTSFFYDAHSSKASEKMWNGVYHNMDLVHKYFNLIQGYRIKFNSYLVVPTFLGLGIYDSSAPFFLWTDELAEMLEKIYYHIFDQSGHYPMIEQPERFMEELRNFIDSNFYLEGCKSI